MEKLPLVYDVRLSQPDAPLALLVHGRGGNRTVMKPFVRCLPEGCTILFPQAPWADRQGRGFDWWEASTASRNPPGRLQAAGESAARLLDFVGGALDYYKLTPRKTIALGFSQGAAILSLIIQQQPERFSAVALLCGFVIENPPVRAAALPVFMGHGRNDRTVPVEQARRGAEHLRASGFSVEYFEDDSAHKVGAESMRELTTWVRLRLSE